MLKSGQYDVIFNTFFFLQQHVRALCCPYLFTMFILRSWNQFIRIVSSLELKYNLCTQYRFISLAVKSSSSSWSSTPTRSTFSTGLWIAATQALNSSPQAASRQSQQSAAAGKSCQLSHLSFFHFFSFGMFLFSLSLQQKLRM